MPALGSTVLLRVTLCAIAGLVLGYANAQTPGARPPSSTSPLATVTALIGDAACDRAAQCSVVPLGAKACGGPDAYLAWSRSTTDEAALLAAVRAYAAAHKQADQASGLVSDCRVTPKPSATCRARAGDGKATCQLARSDVSGAGRLD